MYISLNSLDTYVLSYILEIKAWVLLMHSLVYFTVSYIHEYIIHSILLSAVYDIDGQDTYEYNNVRSFECEQVCKSVDSVHYSSTTC